MIRILPKPQHIEEQEGTLLLDYHCRITIEDRCPRESLFYAQQLAEQIKKMTGIELGIDRRAFGAHKGIELCMDEEAGIPAKQTVNKEAYRLTITPDGAKVCAAQKRRSF